jgi:60 kDa SS-A/Ro ribonucleoprotein
VFTFSDRLVEVPPRRGMSGVAAVINSQPHGSTRLGEAVRALPAHDRLIVVTDEQSHDSVPNPAARGYMINVASAKNGVGYGAWTHLDGFSENVLRFIHETESWG